MFELMGTNDFQSKLLALVQEENAKQAKKDDNYEAKIASLNETVAKQKAKMQELEKQNNDYFAETESQSQEINFLKKQLAESQAELKAEQDKSKRFAERANSLEKVVLAIQQSLSSANTLVDSAVEVINDDKSSIKPEAKVKKETTKGTVANPEQSNKAESEETRNDTEYLLKNKANREALKKSLKEAEEIEKQLDEHGEPKGESKGKSKSTEPKTEDGVEVNFSGEEQAPTKLSNDVPGFERAERDKSAEEKSFEPETQKETFDDTLNQVANTPDPFDNFDDGNGQDDWDNADPYDGNSTFTLSEEVDDSNADMDESGNPNTFQSKSGDENSPWGNSGANFNEGSVESSPETADEAKANEEEVVEDNSAKEQKDEVDDEPLADDSKAETETVSEKAPVEEAKNTDKKQAKGKQVSSAESKGVVSNPKSSSAETQSALEEFGEEKASPADNFAEVETQEERQERNNLPTCADDDKDSSSVSWYFADRLTRLNGDELPPDWTSTQQGRAAFILANFNKMREQIVDEAPWDEEEESAFQEKARKAQEYLNNNPGQKARVEHEVEKGAGKIDD